MVCKSYPFSKLPFSDLFTSYTKGTNTVKPFFHAHPFDDEEREEFLESFSFTGDRNKSADELYRFNKQFGAGNPTLEQIEKLRDERCVAVVTGQQLSIVGGPLFTVYKLLTTIVYARTWEKRYNRPVIPVFWLADEDHDYKEASNAGILADDKFTRLELTGAPDGPAVGRRELGQGFQSFWDELFGILPQTDFTAGLKEEFASCYKAEATFREAFGSLLIRMFGKHGLVLAGSDDPGIKRLISDPLLIASDKHLEVFDRLDSQSRKLEECGFHRQALVQPSNIFYFDEHHGRRKLELTGSGWASGNGKTWSTGELMENLKNFPEKFSPNVFMRPLLQDRLLPTAAYVSGPGETSYYAQMKSLYELMGMTMPIIIPRFSATLIEPPVSRIMDKLPFELSDYSERVEDLESRFLNTLNKKDVESVFTDWKKSVKALTEKKVAEIGDIDPTLKKSADKAGTIFENELNRMKGKVYKSLKKTEEIQLERIRRARVNLFPDSGLQEREVSFISYMNKYGPDVWDRLLESLEGEAPDSHKLIYL